MLKLGRLLAKSPQQLNQSFNHKSQFQYGQVDRFLNRLSKPLYFYLIGANLAIFGMWNMPFINKEFMVNNFTLNKYNLQEMRLHSLITYSFSHSNFLHLMFNMVTFYFFGRTIEAHFGPKRLLTLYLLGSFVGAFLQIKRSDSLALGASAAVNALLTYYICNFPREIIILFVFPVPAWVVGLIILYQSCSGYGSNSGIGHEAHFGGIMAGLGYYLLTRGRV